jgi:hypothetical protein
LTQSRRGAKKKNEFGDDLNKSDMPLAVIPAKAEIQSLSPQRPLGGYPVSNDFLSAFAALRQTIIE